MFECFGRLLADWVWYGLLVIVCVGLWLWWGVCKFVAVGLIMLLTLVLFVMSICWVICCFVLSVGGCRLVVVGSTAWLWLVLGFAYGWCLVVICGGCFIACWRLLAW